MVVSETQLVTVVLRDAVVVVQDLVLVVIGADVVVLDVELTVDVGFEDVEVAERFFVVVLLPFV